MSTKKFKFIYPGKQPKQQFNKDFDYNPIRISRHISGPDIGKSTYHRKHKSEDPMYVIERFNFFKDRLERRTPKKFTRELAPFD